MCSKQRNLALQIDIPWDSGNFVNFDNTQGKW